MTKLGRPWLTSAHDRLILHFINKENYVNHYVFSFHSNCIFAVLPSSCQDLERNHPPGDHATLTPSAYCSVTRDSRRSGMRVHVHQTQLVLLI